MTTLYLGIDPGHTGALAFYDPLMDELSVHDMPIFERAKAGGGSRKRPDAVQLAHIVKDAAQGRTIIAWIEDVGVRAGEGAVGAFTFGFGAGALHGICAALELRVEKVSPSVWKRQMRVTADKDATRMVASKLLPQHARLWPFKKDADRAEAALLALYGSTRSAL